MKQSHLKNPQVNHPVGRAGSKDPSVVMARDQALLADGAGRGRPHLPDDTVCSVCSAVVHGQRWSLNPARAATLIAAGTPQMMICPACRMTAEHSPRGVVTLRGNYWSRHTDEIFNLIRNEDEEARQDNPLERVLSQREEDGCLIVETTNAKLAQKIGRSLQKAHRGSTRFHWEGGKPPVRVVWERVDQQPD